MTKPDWKDTKVNDAGPDLEATAQNFSAIPFRDDMPDGFGKFGESGGEKETVKHAAAVHAKKART